MFHDVAAEGLKTNDLGGEWRPIMRLQGHQLMDP